MSKLRGGAEFTTATDYLLLQTSRKRNHKCEYPSGKALKRCGGKKTKS